MWFESTRGHFLLAYGIDGGRVCYNFDDLMMGIERSCGES